jgi:NADH-quinone oxidoreductase subunit L
VLAKGSRALGGYLWNVGDQRLIDGGLVNGSARTVGLLSGVLRNLQSGYLYHYAFAMIVGLAMLVGWLVFKT